MIRLRALRIVLLALLLTAIVACAGDAPTPTPTTSRETPTTPTPGPTLTPTATPRPATTPTATPVPIVSPIGDPPAGFRLHVDAENGFGLHYPNAWRQGTLSNAFGADVVLETTDGTLRIAIYTGIEAADTTAELRADQTAKIFAELLGEPSEIASRDPLALDNGDAMLRRDLLYPPSESARDLHLYLLTEVLRTYVVTVSGSRSTLDGQAALVERVLRSFVAFEPARFGVPRELSLTMPGDDPITLDPAMSREATSHLYVSHIFSGLVRFDESLAIQMDLAESVDVDETGTVYTFVLRDGVTFHNGRRITAEDVRYSFERAADPSLNSPTAGLYLSDVVGVDEKLAGDAQSIAGIEVVNDRTVRLTIDAPKAYFLAKLTYPTAFVVDRNDVQPRGAEWWKGAINGSGPFKLKEWTEGELVVLERFDGYHTPASLPYAVFPINFGTPLQLYEAGIGDVAFIGGALIDRARDPSGGLGGRLREFPQFLVNYVGFNAQEPPFDDPKVRRAFALAIDRQDLLDVVFGPDVELAKGLLPPGLPGYNPGLEAIPYDPALARQLLRESKYGVQYSSGGFPDVVFTTSSFGAVSGDIQYMVGQWSTNLGIDVQVRGLDPNVYYYALASEVDNLFDYGWIADYPDPQNFLDVLLHSRSAENNVGGYSNREFDRLLEEARSEPDHARRMDLYQRAERLMLDDAAIIPLYHAPDYVLTKPYVDGFHVSPLGVPLLQNVRILPR